MQCRGDPFGEYFNDARYVQQVERRQLTEEELNNEALLKMYRDKGWTIRDGDGMLIEKSWNVHRIKEDIIHRHLRPTVPPQTPPSVRDIILRCWEHNPDHRCVLFACLSGKKLTNIARIYLVRLSRRF